ncbi:ABC transporter ATP-binding protein [Branchiibius sp. NY16-3462-2]|uniref:ABC transporter ATP-binding protein n=1 Tax=Branchiibius sp. NY16-3462-2 TaxID=1807500 RepID=UPI0007957379|nr:ATP-binding cassette domain-containing protein [Branchiibius sp. NY16-3462-2]KYH45172.1 ABC transporter [Branchiibius sp. NY16-3462-2]
MIVTENLTKRYGSMTAVDDVSFVARAGAVTGFLGPNGAGKSTAMRMMTALTPPTSGRALVLGREYRDIPNPGRHVGVMLDASAQHVGRTGGEVLRLVAMQLGLGKDAVPAALARVGLSEKEADRRVRNYSLGMRQRLGLAGALLGDPQVLILDEPANGLDPQGIHWMRTLLRDFADRGGTVLLSSHLLHEVEIVADELVMIGHGRIVAQGSKAELLGNRGSIARSLDAPALANALVAAGFEANPDRDAVHTAASTQEVGRAALAAGVVLTELRAAGSDGLEEMFLQLTADHAREGATP